MQQIEQNGLLKNIFIYQTDGERVTTWVVITSAAVDSGVLGMGVISGWAKKASGGVLDGAAFTRRAAAGAGAGRARTAGTA